MPITIMPVDGTVVSPGMPISLVSDFVGPVPLGTEFVTSWFRGPTHEIQFLEEHLATNLTHNAYQILGTQAGTSIFVGEAPAEGESVFARVQLVQPGQVPIDEGEATWTWSPTRSLGWQINTKPSGGQGGLTPSQAQQLSSIEDATVPVISTDTLTLEEVTNGPQGGFVGAALPDFVFGVIIRLASIPPDVTPETPDGAYWFNTLAVLRVYRGSDLWLRVPIHTVSKIVPFMEENVVTAVSATLPTQWLLNMSIQVYFRPDVTGQVFLMHFP